MVTKKTISALAKALKKEMPDKPDEFEFNNKEVLLWNQWVHIMDNVADVCQDNSRTFDRERFVKACGYIE